MLEQENEVDKGIAGSALMSSAKTGSGSDCHGTPPWLYAFLNRGFGPFDLDPCADAVNAKCERYFTEADDGLKQVWTGMVFINPPYSQLKAWVKKAYDSVYVDKTAQRCVMLVPARTDTDVWHSIATKGLVFLLKGRLVFVQPQDVLQAATEKWFAKRKLTATQEQFQKKYDEIKRTGAPFPSAVLVFDRDLKQPVTPDIGIGTPMNAYAVDWTEENTKEIPQ